MVLVGSVFILSSALIYIVFILLMIFISSIAVFHFNMLVLRIIGGVVLVMGIVTFKEVIRKGNKSITFLNMAEKSAISRRAGKVIRKFQNSDSIIGKISVIGSVILFAFFVNSIEIGCTAVLPAVYMSSLLLTYGAELGFYHIFWTVIYGIIYIVPMLFILLNFLFTFRSRRVEEEYGNKIKSAGSIVMMMLGLVLIISPSVLSF